MQNFLSKWAKRILRPVLIDGRKVRSPLFLMLGSGGVIERLKRLLRGHLREYAKAFVAEDPPLALQNAVAPRVPAWRAEYRRTAEFAFLGLLEVPEASLIFPVVHVPKFSQCSHFLKTVFINPHYFITFYAPLKPRV